MSVSAIHGFAVATILLTSCTSPRHASEGDVIRLSATAPLPPQCRDRASRAFLTQLRAFGFIVSDATGDPDWRGYRIAPSVQRCLAHIPMRNFRVESPDKFAYPAQRSLHNDSLLFGF